MDRPEAVKISGVRKESSNVNTLALDKKADGDFGQFYMVWVPGEGEKPYASSRLGKNIELTVRIVGPFSEKLAGKKKGEYIGIRGPYGKGTFKLKGKEVCFIAGGVGIVPLIPLIESREAKSRKKTVILGAKNKEGLLFLDRIKKSKSSLTIATDDGSIGEKAFPHEIFRKLLKEKRFDQVYCCGPEAMMKKVLDICLKEKIPCQMSLERFIKCGIGICGSCALDPEGLLVCRDGPVFTGEELEKSEFGRYRRDASGSKP